MGRPDFQRSLEMTDRPFFLTVDTEQDIAETIMGFRIAWVEGHGLLEQFDGSPDVVLCLEIVFPHKAASIISDRQNACFVPLDGLQEEGLRLGKVAPIRHGIRIR